MRTSQEIIKDINSFKPENGNWIKLDNLIIEFWGTADYEKEIKNLFGVLERFPESDGNEVFWTIVHGLEDCENYEEELLRSLARQPSFMGLIMLRRIINTGQQRIGDTDINDITIDLMNHKLTSDKLKGEIKKIQG